MDENKYVCEPHYDEKGNFDYWNPLFPYKHDTCEGCKYEHFKNEILCPGCSRDKRDNYKPAKVVE